MTHNVRVQDHFQPAILIPLKRLRFACRADKAVLSMPGIRRGDRRDPTEDDPVFLNRLLCVQMSHVHLAPVGLTLILHGFHQLDQTFNPNSQGGLFLFGLDTIVCV